MLTSLSSGRSLDCSEISRSTLQRPTTRRVFRREADGRLAAYLPVSQAASPGLDAMRWKRIALFVPLGFIATATAAFPFGFLAGLAESPGDGAPFWLRAGQAVAVSMATVLTLGWLAFIQRERTPIHLYVTAFSMWALSVVPNVLLFGRPFAQWVSGAVLSGLFATIRLGAGLALRKATDALGHHLEAARR